MKFYIDIRHCLGVQTVIMKPDTFAEQSIAFYIQTLFEELNCYDHGRSDSDYYVNCFLNNRIDTIGGCDKLITLVELLVVKLHRGYSQGMYGVDVLHGFVLALSAADKLNKTGRGKGGRYVTDFRQTAIDAFQTINFRFLLVSGYIRMHAQIPLPNQVIGLTAALLLDDQEPLMIQTLDFPFLLEPQEREDLVSGYIRTHSPRALPTELMDLTMTFFSRPEDHITISRTKPQVGQVSKVSKVSQPNTQATVDTEQQAERSNSWCVTL